MGDRVNTDLTTQKEQAKGGNDTQSYDEEAVVALLKMMKKDGYGDRKKQKTALKNVFEDDVKLEKGDFGFRRTAKDWTKNFTWISQDYSYFSAKLSESGRSTDDEGIFEKPEFFAEINEMEFDKSQHYPPEHIDSVISTDEVAVSSSRTRAKSAIKSTLQEFMEKA